MGTHYPRETVLGPRQAFENKYLHQEENESLIQAILNYFFFLTEPSVLKYSFHENFLLK